MLYSLPLKLLYGDFMKKRIESRPANDFSFRTTSLILALLWSSICIADIGVGYKVVFQGITNKTMLENLKAVSKMVSLRDNPPLTLGLLRFRAKNDVNQCLSVLRDQGYYEAKVVFEIDDKEKPVLVTFHIKPGKPAWLDQIMLCHLSEPEAPTMKI